MDLRIALGQINPATGDIRGNVAKILRFVDEAVRQECQLVAFPEMAVSGYCLDEKLMMNRRFIKENKQAVMEQVAAASLRIPIIVGFIDFDPERVGSDGFWLRYNAAAVCLDGQCTQVVHKSLLPGYRYFEDPRYFTPGSPSAPFILQVGGSGIRVGVEICEDLWDDNYPVKPSRELARLGSQVIVSINASPYVCASPGKRDAKIFERRSLARRQTQAHKVPIVYVNTVGVGDNGKNVIPFDGGSFTLDSRGELIQSSAQFSEELGIAVLRSRDGTGTAIEEPPFDREAEMYTALCMGVRDYYEKVGTFDGILESLSGGIDSALGACIAVDAVGKDKVEALGLPSRHNSETTQEIARALAANLGILYTLVPIQESVDAIIESYRRALGDFQAQVSLENIQSRVRGILLMARSNDRNRLLLSNGNETEIATGYATLYGDMCGGLAVIGDLSKPDVYRLSRYVNRKHGREIIPEAAFAIAPSAELAPGQQDPFDYDVVGPLIAEFIEKRRTRQEITQRFQDRTLDTFQFVPVDGKSVYRRYDEESFAALVGKTYSQLNHSVYKRLQGPPILVISERGFGFDLRETLLNSWD